MKDYKFREYSKRINTKDGSQIDIYSIQPSRKGPETTIYLTDFLKGEGATLNYEDLLKLREALDSVIQMSKEVYEIVEEGDDL